MKKIKIFVSAILSVFLASCSNILTVEVRNTLDFDRHPEMVEIDMREISLDKGTAFIVKDSKGVEVPYQITSDGMLIFQVEMKANGKETFKICKGEPAEYESLVFGKHYAEKDDDFAWENDKAGYRMYGHKLDVASGYDIFCKRGTRLPVLEKLYANEVYSSDAWKRYYELEAVSAEEAFRFKMDTLSFHVDRGYGMDVYAVGPTLGAGIAALMKDDVIAYPRCYETYEILDMGPLRFRVRFTFRPLSDEICNGAIETRVITLDAGSYLNHTSVSFSGLDSPREIVAGIVLREDGRDAIAEAEKGYIAYSAPTQNHDTRKEVDNGTIYIGHVYPSAVKEAKAAHGHVMTVSDYTPGSEFVYYWGSGWNHAEMLSSSQWYLYLETFSKMVRNPLEITIR